MGNIRILKLKVENIPRDNFFGKNPEVLKMIEKFSDDEVENLNRGGHDPIKVYNAYRLAYENKTKPTVILAFTIKGYGIGSRQADNTTHQVKKLTKENLENFIDKFNLPVKKNNLENPDFLDLSKHKELNNYLHERRKALGGLFPKEKFQRKN